MRTTLSLDDDALEGARRLAIAHRQTLGQAVSELMRKGLAARSAYPADEDGFPVFRVAEGSPPLTLEDVGRHEDEPA